MLITSLFLVWGFCNGMIDILNKHYQDTLRINRESRRPVVDYGRRLLVHSSHKHWHGLRAA